MWCADRRNIYFTFALLIIELRISTAVGSTYLLDAVADVGSTVHPYLLQLCIYLSPSYPTARDYPTLYEDKVRTGFSRNRQLHALLN